MVSMHGMCYMDILILCSFSHFRLFNHVYVGNFLEVNGGREGRPIGAYELAQAVEELGAGEILLNCINCDGNESLFSTDNMFGATL